MIIDHENDYFSNFYKLVQINQSNNSYINYLLYNLDLEYNYKLYKNIFFCYLIILFITILIILFKKSLNDNINNNDNSNMVNLEDYNLNSIYNENETLENEFKEFCLKKCPSLTFENDEIIDIIKFGWRSEIQNLVEENIKIYIQRYFPKYYCSFMNSNTKGKLIFGIDDLSRITGIPFSKEKSHILTKEYILNIINLEASKYISKFDASKINVKITKLNIIPELLENNSHFIENHNSERAIFKTKYNQYLKKYKKWEKELFKYGTKLVNILNEKQLKLELIEFIKSKLLKKKYIEHRDIIEKIIEKIKSDEYINISENDILPDRNYKPTNYIYWVINFKDTKMSEICSKRPQKPYEKYRHFPQYVLAKLSELQSVFYKDVDYYTITIFIDGFKNNNLFDSICDNIYKKQILYKPYNKNKWIYQERRLIDDFGPVSL